MGWADDIGINKICYTVNRDRVIYKKGGSNICYKSFNVRIRQGYDGLPEDRECVSCEDEEKIVTWKSEFIFDKSDDFIVTQDPITGYYHLSPVQGYDFSKSHNIVIKFGKPSESVLSSFSGDHALYASATVYLCNRISGTSTDRFIVYDCDNYEQSVDNKLTITIMPGSSSDFCTLNYEGKYYKDPWGNEDID